MQSRLYLVLGIAIMAIVALPTLVSANLVVEGGFENNNLAPLGSIVSPLTPGLWGYEAASRVNSGPGITPRTGQWMLKMVDDGLMYTQALQFIDITAYSSLQAGAYFNSDATAALAVLNLHYYANAGGWGSPISSDTSTLILDSKPETWELISYASSKPLGATWVGIEVAFSNASIQGHAGYVDDVSLSEVPEPSGVVALLTGLSGIASFGLRRRHSA